MAEDNEVSEAILEGRVAQVVWGQAMEAFSESKDMITVLMGLLPICRAFPWAQRLEELILKDLQEKHGEQEETWHAVARSQLDREHTSKAKKRQVYLTCHNTYEKAVKSLPTEKMWSLYLTTCLELLQQEELRWESNKRVHKAVEVFNKACNAHLLSEDMFVKWLDVLAQTGQVSLLESILSTSVQHHPSSVMLWRRRLQHQSLEADTEAMQQLFQEALGKVAEQDSLPLWQVLIEYTMVHDPDKLTTLLEDGLGRCREVCIPIKEVFLGWVAVTGGLKAARKLYKRLSPTKPVSLEFFKKYIDVERAQAAPKLQKLRRAYEDALQEYGTSNTGR